MKKILLTMLTLLSIHASAMQQMLEEQRQAFHQMRARLDTLQDQVENRIFRENLLNSGEQQGAVKRTCFKEGTWVLGPEMCKAIEDLTIGDEVLSLDESTGEYVTRQV